MSRKGFFSIGRLPSVLQSRFLKRSELMRCSRSDSSVIISRICRIRRKNSRRQRQADIFDACLSRVFLSLSIYVQLPTRGMKAGTTKYPPSLRADCCYSNRTFGPVGNLKKRRILNFRDKRGRKGRSSRAEAASVLTSVRNGTRFASPAEEKCHLRARARLLTPVSP